MQTWSIETLVSNIINADKKYSAVLEDGEYNPEYKKRLDKLNRCYEELLSRLDISDNERKKIYKNGYDQGRFDEAADLSLCNKTFDEIVDSLNTDYPSEMGK